MSFRSGGTWLTLVALGLPAGCTDSADESILDGRWCVTSVELTPRTITLGVGDSAVFTAHVQAAIPSCEFSNEHNLAWSLSDSSVATIRAERGSTVSVIGLAAGKATLFVRMRAFDAVAASEVFIGSH